MFWGPSFVDNWEKKVAMEGEEGVVSSLTR